MNELQQHLTPTIPFIYLECRGFKHDATTAVDLWVQVMLTTETDILGLSSTVIAPTLVVTMTSSDLLASWFSDLKQFGLLPGAAQWGERSRTINAAS